MRIVLLIGSAPDAERAHGFSADKFDAIVAVNNAWRIRTDWTHAIYPEDFPVEKRPAAGPNQTIITYEAFVPANNAFGGVIYAGATMAYTAGYWALHTLRPDILAFIGSDMVYDDPVTHFYGRGVADPLRDDPTLSNLKAKSDRLLWLAAKAGCLCVNLSENQRSKLTFPRLDAERLGADLVSFRQENLDRLIGANVNERADVALVAERSADCFVEGGDYWNAPEQWDAKKLRVIDDLWLRVFE